MNYIILNGAAFVPQLSKFSKMFTHLLIFLTMDLNLGAKFSPGQINQPGLNRRYRSVKSITVNRDSLFHIIGP